MRAACGVRHPRMWDFSVAHKNGWISMQCHRSIFLEPSFFIYIAAEDEVRALPPSFVADQIQRRQHRQNSEVGVGERARVRSVLCPRFKPRPMQQQLLSSAAIKCLLAYSCLSLSPSSAFFWPSCFRVCLQADRAGRRRGGQGT